MSEDYYSGLTTLAIIAAIFAVIGIAALAGLIWWTSTVWINRPTIGGL